MTLIILLLVSGLLPVVVLLFALAALRMRRQIAALTIEARHDLLTGLPNRRGLAAHWQTLPEPRGLILIDLVGFKAVNDSHGHIVGDALLKQVAARLASVVAPPGLLARWGGDEFVAVIPAARMDAQQALIANARVMAYDLSESGGPTEVRIGARTGVSAGEAELGLAIRSAARALMEEKAIAA